MSNIQVVKKPGSLPMGAQYSSMPRPQGDGMDSEDLRIQEIIVSHTPQQTKPVKGRHGNLSSSSHTTTHVKAQSPKFIPHEPVKGAVKPVSQIISSRKSGSGHSYGQATPQHFKLKQKASSKGNFDVSMRQGEAYNLKPVQQPASNPTVPLNVPSAGNISVNKNSVDNCNVLQQSLFPVKSSSTNASKRNHELPTNSGMGRSGGATQGKEIVKTVQVPVYNAPSHLKMSTYETIQRQQKDKINKTGPVSKKPTDLQHWQDSVSLTLGSSSYNHNDIQTDSVILDMDGRNPKEKKVVLPEVNMDLVANALEELRLTEGQSGQPGQSCAELDDAKKQLEAQIKVNTDLKKLLVASMGDDLHYTVERLVRDRVQLSEEIGGFTKKMYQDHEDLDKLAIQADMWRSKYMASRVMVEQLTSLRDELSRQIHMSQHAIYQTMQERHQLRDLLLQIHRHLRQLKDAFDPSSSKKYASNSPATVLDLANTNLQLADSAKFRLLGPLQPAPEPWDRVGHDALTPAEQMAYMLLSNSMSEESRAWLASSSVNLDEYKRFHPQVRYDNLTFNCCRKCKGDIHVI